MNRNKEIISIISENKLNKFTVTFILKNKRNSELVKRVTDNSIAQNALFCWSLKDMKSFKNYNKKALVYKNLKVSYLKLISYNPN